ncbi:MAG: chorismate synthase [bacterium]|nr:chorismate synthase [bacterium]
MDGQTNAGILVQLAGDTTLIRYLTAGESHGAMLTGIVDGIPANLKLSVTDIDTQLARRQRGYGRGERMAIESDHIEITGGVRYGKTTGAPIGLLLRNRDWENWRTKLSVEASEEPTAPLTMPRPGHADYAGALKYAQHDIRNVIERASARETAMRVAVGAICRTLLAEFGITIYSHVVQIGTISHNNNPTLSDLETADNSPLRCIDPVAEEAMMQCIDECKARGDTVGGVIEIIAFGVPVGIGSYGQGDSRIDGRIAGALMSIPAVKTVAIGAIDATELIGSAFHDTFLPDRETTVQRPTNRAGGIEGGITNGEPIVVRVTMKPLASLTQPLASVDLKTGEAVEALRERSDVCAVPAAGVVAENLLAIVLADAFLQKVGGDSIEEVTSHYNAWGDRWRTFS